MIYGSSEQFPGGNIWEEVDMDVGNILSGVNSSPDLAAAMLPDGFGLQGSPHSFQIADIQRPEQNLPGPLPLFTLCCDPVYFPTQATIPHASSSATAHHCQPSSSVPASSQYQAPYQYPAPVKSASTQDSASNKVQPTYLDQRCALLCWVQSVRSQFATLTPQEAPAGASKYAVHVGGRRLPFNIISKSLGMAYLAIAAVCAGLPYEDIVVDDILNKELAVAVAQTCEQMVIKFVLQGSQDAMPFVSAGKNGFRLKVHWENVTRHPLLWGSDVQKFKERLHGLPFSTFFHCLSQVVMSGAILSLCVDWLAILGRQPDEIALMQSFLAETSKHSVEVPTIIVAWATYWYNNWGKAFDTECPALFGNMAQWMPTCEAPSWLPAHGCSAANKYVYRYQTGMHENATAAAAPALICCRVHCVFASLVVCLLLCIGRW